MGIERIVRLSIAGRKDLQTLAVQIEVGPDGQLPTEVRLFKAGDNPTRKGVFLFDARGAAETMAAYRAHGVDVMIDLEHLSLDDEAPNYDPDARGWGKFELREGDLWLVGITWAGDGPKRLTTRTQRYVSPAFAIDDERRIVEVYNVALVAQPATDFAMPLAASRNEGSKIMDWKQLCKLARQIKAAKPGETHEKTLETLAIDLKTLQAMGKLLGVDAGADLGALMAAVISFAEELQSPQQKAPEEPAPEEPKPEEPAAMAASRATTAELETLRNEAAKQAKLVAELKSERDAREMTERVELVGELVKLGRETPATAWDNSDGKTPRGHLRSMPIVELRDRVESFRKAGPQMAGATHTPPGNGGATQSNEHEISEYELARLKVACERSGCKVELAEQRYAEHKTQQIIGAATTVEKRRYSRKLEQGDVLANQAGRFGDRELVLLTNPVKPIEEFGASSQRAQEEFRLEYNTALASMPETWAESIGQMLPSGSLRQTFPLAFDYVVYREKVAQNAAARTPKSVDITVDKRQFRAGKQALLKRIQGGDFAYIQTWQQGAQQMARARAQLRNQLIATLLEAGTSGYWGYSSLLATGIDGQPFFSASHMVDPFDPAQTYLTSTTWGNYQSSAKPLNATNLTGEKASMMLVPACDGQHIGGRATSMMVPTVLDETSRLLLTVQDLILAADEQTSGTGKFGTVKNEHYQSGFTYSHCPELAGTGATADYYLISQERIAAGLVPWAIAEDSGEELLTWDESSDFYKDTDHIKVESKIYINGCLLWPHGIRLVKGA